LDRQVRALLAKARQSGWEEDGQQARLAVMERRQVAIEVFRERVEQYPTDLRLKYKLGAILFEAGDYDQAIPMLQAAHGEPRSRVRSQLLIGQAFLRKENPAQAAEVLREALDRYELTEDVTKEFLYWLGRACQAAGKVEEAKAAYGRLLRQDYNYMDGDARQRLESLTSRSA
jgi:tetratricopeptide (TPR) repeat protein